jgi:hypothetical protein
VILEKEAPPFERRASQVGGFSRYYAYIETCPGVMRPPVRTFVAWLKTKTEEVTAAEPAS